jgi:hypothetical protein
LIDTEGDGGGPYQVARPMPAYTLIERAEPDRQVVLVETAAPDGHPPGAAGPVPEGCLSGSDGRVGGRRVQTDMERWGEIRRKVLVGGVLEAADLSRVRAGWRTLQNCSILDTTQVGGPPPCRRGDPGLAADTEQRTSPSPSTAPRSTPTASSAEFSAPTPKTGTARDTPPNARSFCAF